MSQREAFNSVAGGDERRADISESLGERPTQKTDEAKDETCNNTLLDGLTQPLNCHRTLTAAAAAADDDNLRLVDEDATQSKARKVHDTRNAKGSEGSRDHCNKYDDDDDKNDAAADENYTDANDDEEEIVYGQSSRHRKHPKATSRHKHRKHKKKLLHQTSSSSCLESNEGSCEAKAAMKSDDATRRKSVRKLQSKSVDYDDDREYEANVEEAKDEDIRDAAAAAAAHDIDDDDDNDDDSEYFEDVNGSVPTLAELRQQIIAEIGESLFSRVYSVVQDAYENEAKNAEERVVAVLGEENAHLYPLITKLVIASCQMM